MPALTRSIPTAHGRSIAKHLPQLRAALEQQRTFRTEQLADLDAQTAGGSTITSDAGNEVTNALRAARPLL